MKKVILLFTTLLLIVLIGCGNGNKVNVATKNEAINKYNEIVTLIKENSFEEAYNKLPELSSVENYDDYLHTGAFNELESDIRNGLDNKAILKINLVLFQLSKLRNANFDECNKNLSDISLDMYSVSEDINMLRELIKSIQSERYYDAFLDLKNMDGTKYKRYSLLSDSLLNELRNQGYSIAENSNDNQSNKSNSLVVEIKSLHKSGDYTYFEGILKNNTDNTYSYVKIKATYYDSSMNVLTTDWTYAVSSEGISPNENKQFELMTKVSGEVSKGKLEILDYQ